AAAVDALVGRPAHEAVADLVAEALARPLPEPPPWFDDAPPQPDTPEFEAYVTLNAMRVNEYRAGWMASLHTGGLREKLTLFWHNHFVTSVDTYFLAPFAYRYLTLLRTHTLGNFRAFVDAIGRDAAMLVYLNGTQNRRGAPNENYARELLELFTMGPTGPDGSPNYTETDIQEIARALTGWVVDYFTLTTQHVLFLFDDGEKSFFGRTGRFGYDDVVSILFEERGSQIAHFICRKLYAEFVYAVPDDALVADLAQVMLDNDFALAPVIQTLLSSAHFFDEQVIGAQVKSPVGLLTGLLSETGTTPPDALYPLLLFGALLAGQLLLDPPNVAGWPGHHAWLSTSTLPTRWLLTDYLLFGADVMPPMDLTALAEALHDPDDPLAPFKLPVALAEHFLPAPLAEIGFDAGGIDFAGGSAPVPDEILNGPEHERELAKIFLEDVPWYEWSLSLEGAPFVLLRFVRYLMQVPEFQLT
ncbi:MAG: DUF1800 domain-containing protein, partial [Bacteroidetes bacterium]